MEPQQFNLKSIASTYSDLNKVNEETLFSYKKNTTLVTYDFLDFFSGSGLVTEGFKGVFQPIWANDICEKKAAVYTANHSTKYFHLGSVSDVKGHDIPFAPLAWASFPCQDLSLAGLVKGINGARSGLVWEWLRIIDEMQQRPQLLVAENVAGLLSIDGGEHYRLLHRALVKRGYSVGALLINASHWVPQSRVRVFIVAVDSETTIPSNLIAPRPTWLHPEIVQRAGQGLNNWVWWNMPQPPARKKKLFDIIDWDAPYAETKTDKHNIRLISNRHAARLNELPNEVLALPGYKRTRGGEQVLELRFDELAGCLRTPKGGSSRQLLIIRKNGKLHSRLLTERETARLMGAPETYKLPGSYNDVYKAMGDAVVVPVVRWLAKKLLLPILSTYDK